MLLPLCTIDELSLIVVFVATVPAMTILVAFVTVVSSLNLTFFIVTVVFRIFVDLLSHHSFEFFQHLNLQF